MQLDKSQKNRRVCRKWSTPGCKGSLSLSLSCVSSGSISHTLFSVDKEAAGAYLHDIISLSD